MEGWFGTSWSEVGRVSTTTLAIYITVVVALRIAGRRTVSQMSAFDFVVTIAIGSLVAATSLSPDVGYGRGVTGIVTLLAAQQAVAILRQRIPATRRLFDFSPEPLYSDGGMKLRHNLMTAQVTEAELHSKLRHHGIASLGDVDLVILEPDGRVSVLRNGDTAELWRAARD